MSGTASVSNTFANQSGPIPLSQLDANFTSLVDYANDPTNRNNYAADTGVASTYTVALSPAVAGYTAGLMITFKPGNSNTSSSSINVNALGAKTIVNGAGANVTSGEIVAGRPLTVVYDGTAFVTPTGLATASSGAAKAWGQITYTTASYVVTAGHNIASISRGGTGTVTVVFSTPFSSSNFAFIASPEEGAFNPLVGSRGTATMVIGIYNTATGVAEDASFNFVAFGSLS